MVDTQYWLGLTDRVQEDVWTWDVDASFNPNITLAQPKNSSDEIFVRWDPGHPISNNSDDIDCSTISLASGRFQSQHCERQKFRFICEKDAKGQNPCQNIGQIRIYRVTKCHRRGKFKDNPLNRVCERGWTRKDLRKPVCIQVFTEALTWTEAVEKCREHNLTLLTIDGQIKVNMLKSIGNTWIGLNDRKKEGVYQWLDQPSSYHEGVLQEKAPKVKGCAVFLPDGTWQEQLCSSLFPFMCQKESADGPSEVGIRTKSYHYKKGLILPNEIMTVTCSSLGTESGDMALSVLDERTGMELERKPAVTNQELVKTYEGQCRIKTTYSFRLVVSGSVLLRISCFSHKYRATQTCQSPVLRLQFCNNYIKNITLPDGPYQPPELNVTYKGFPGPIELPNTVKATCAAYIGTFGEIFWAIYDKYDYRVENDQIGQPLKISSTVTIDPSLGPHEFSELELKMKPYMSGMSIACFAYNADQYLYSVECDARDRYCVQTGKIKVKRYKFKAFDGSSSSMTLLFLLVAIPGTVYLFSKHINKEMKKAERGLESARQRKSSHLSVFKKALINGSDRALRNISSTVV